MSLAMSPFMDSVRQEAVDHDRHMRRAFELAAESRDRGDEPFGALLVDDHGVVMLEARNSVASDRDRTAHAERTLLTRAGPLFTAERLRRATMYTSTEPCAMCSGAAYSVGIGRVVYGLSESVLHGMMRSDPLDPLVDFRCRNVLEIGPGQIEVVGPWLEDEAAEVHAGYWSAGG